ncbi:MAG TPA: HEPN domain-containing protein [Candidatus Saccharimonadales bacterium]|nr:HEPN domain-containing protein [Candidatus Saccharimonadales bacterium]
MNDKNIEQFQEWQKRAEEDFGSAKMLLDNDGFPSVVCFHAHQVIEKYLKGYLAYQDKEPQKTHQLDILLEECVKMDESFRGYIEEAVSLNDYYIEARYPTDFREDIPLSEAKEALEKAEKIRDAVVSKIQSN